MTLLLKQLFNLIKLLNSETGTAQISWGIALGFVLGMSPAFSLQTLLVIFLLFIFRIQLGAALSSAFFFKFTAFFLDPVFHPIGSAILEAPNLSALFTQLYNMPIVPYTRFNDSIVLGAGVLSILLCPLVFVVSQVLIKKYRKAVVEKFQETKFWKAVKATSLYKWYYNYEQIAG